MKIKLEAAARLTATSWWDALDKDQKQEYISEHPDSKYAKQGTGGGEPADKPKALTEGPKAPGPLTAPPALEEGPGEVPDSPDETEEDVKKPAQKKPTPKKPKSKEDSLTHFLYEKGKYALSDLGHKALEKSKKGILHRLIDPMGLTHPKEIGPKKSKAPKSKSSPAKKSPTKPNRGGKPAPKSSSKVKQVQSPGFKKSGGKGISPYGYWKDDDTWVSETKQEWESKLTPEERKKFGR
jgi:hypothetical protein